jgi:hypothetical protein
MMMMMIIITIVIIDSLAKKSIIMADDVFFTQQFWEPNWFSSHLRGKRVKSRDFARNSPKRSRFSWAKNHDTIREQ